MIRIHMIGSSHVAALRAGWALIEDRYPEVEMTFSAIVGLSYRRLQINQDKQFGALTKGRFSNDQIAEIEAGFGHPVLDLSQYDIVLQAGHFMLEDHYVRMMGGFSVDALQPICGRPRLSQTAHNHFAAQLVQHMIPKTNWRNWDSPRLVVIPKPRVSERVLAETNDTTPLVTLWRRFAQGNDAAARLLDSYEALCREACKAAGVTLMSLPDRLHGTNGLTKKEFSRQPVKLNAGGYYGEDDFEHKNADYGACVMSAVMDQTLKTTQSKES